ncbi:MAG: sulfatase-like hydrolase/transferase [bacterium]|nr:sulfatase-like hydrolase/transferase [bacterium]
MKKRLLNHFKINFTNLITYGTLKFLMVLLLLTGYFAQVELPDSSISWIYAITLPSYYYVFVFLSVFILMPVYLIPYVRYSYVLIFFLLDFYLVTDAVVTYVYRYHINQTLISMFIFDFKGMGIPKSILAIALIIAIILLIMNLFIFRWSINKKKRFPLLLIPIFLFLILLNQGIHAGASGFKIESVTRYTPYFPLFYPLTSAKTIKKLKKQFPDLMPEQEHDKNGAIFNSSNRGSGSLQYPLIAPLCKEPEKKYDILFFVLESWRSDMMNKEVTPNIFKLSKKSYVFKNHLSGGNATVPGLFSLMYGLHSSYIEEVTAQPSLYPPLFMEVLKQNNYETHIYTSSNLTRFSLREMFFNERDYKNYAYIEKGARDLDDKEITRIVEKSILTDQGENPLFRFLFLTSSHSDYDYPEKHKIFTPVSEDASFAFNRQTDPEPFLNDYKNSLHYLDSRFGRLLRALEDTNALDHTVIVITSDHAEEFNDNKTGFWGHGSNFTRAQVSVPLVIFFPDNKDNHTVNKRSGHVDVMPTLLNSLFQCKPPYSDYSSGLNLFDLPESRSLIVGSYVNSAYVIDNTVYSRGFGIKSYNFDNISQENKDFDYEKIRELMSEEIHFIGKQ